MHMMINTSKTESRKKYRNNKREEESMASNSMNEKVNASYLTWSKNVKK